MTLCNALGYLEVVRLRLVELTSWRMAAALSKGEIFLPNGFEVVAFVAF